MKHYKTIFAAIFLFIVAIYSYGQSLGRNTNELSSVFIYTGAYQTRTIYNIRVRENNVYKGHAFREIRENFSLVADTPFEKKFAGRTFIFEELKSQGRDLVRKVNNIIDGSFIVNRDGSIERDEDSIFPRLLGFPVFPEQQNLRIGSTWEAAGSIVVDPLRKNLFTKINFISEYRYAGITHFQGVEVHSITARYAMRYNQGDDPYGDQDLLRVSGSRNATIYITTKDYTPFFIQKNIDEVYTFPSLAVSMRGFSHIWYSNVVPMKRDVVKNDIMESIIRSSLDIEDFDVKEIEEGISLTTNNIHFVPDRAELLPGENRKVEIISTILRRIPDRTFLIVGHTADVGTAESQMELSILRAERIAQLLRQYGISSDRLIFTGKGGTIPVGNNATEEGRARNRRVEIIILED